MHLSLRLKLILAFISVAVVAVGGVILFVNLDSQRQMQNYAARGGQYGLTSLVAGLENLYQQQGSWLGVETYLAENNPRRGAGGSRGKELLLTMTNGEGVVLWSSSGEKAGSTLNPKILEKGIQLVTRDGQVCGYLVVANSPALSIDTLSPFVTRMTQAVTYSGILAILVAVILAVVISSYLLKPVRSLTLASKKLSTGDFKTRVNIRGNDELSELGTTFNRMAVDLESAEERKKSLTADVAHELRTPIAVQKAQLESMLDGVLPVNEENLNIALQQADMLSRIVDDLSLLALADSGEIRLEFRATDVQQLVEDVSAQFKLKLQQEGMKIVCEYNPQNGQFLITSDSDRITQILHNLLSNAIRYGKKNGLIQVDVEEKDQILVIAVRDDGPGIPEDAIPHLFERFYRHEKARSRETGGTGLGLAIAKKLARLLGGDLTGGNYPQGGAVFTLTLPRDAHLP
ncbi:MAG TPA: ATP-binding protein [Anaerolineaceae bacterium]|nr:ATP-binding protein [Anaerolineaceae bacterium]